MTQQAASRRWTPSTLLYASAAVHAGAAAAVILRPPVWPWAVGAIAANHLVLTAAGLWPRSQLLGPNLTRLPAPSGNTVAITIDDGPEPNVTPQVLELLAKYGTCVTFFCVGERVLRHADLAREIVHRGHAIENHSQRHRHDFSLLGPKRMSSEISRAQDSIFSVTGTLPQFFRAPAGLRNPFLDPILQRLGLRLASWTRRGFDTLSGDADTVYRRVANPLRGGDILLMHDGNAARSSRGAPVILEVLPRLLDTLASRGLKTATLRSTLSLAPP
jgi:peptidoglycan/xylan/chitin deacetylase (PgdA/CDA1 family)